MNQIPKLRQLHEFLGKEPDALRLYSYSLQLSPYEDQQKALAEAIGQYDAAARVEGRSGTLCERAVEELIKEASTITHSSFNIGESLLYDLTILALGASGCAGHACYELGQIYSKRDSRYSNSSVKRSDLLAAYFFGLALEKGCVHHRSKIAYAEACARMGWFDTALRWMPENAQEYHLAKAYLQHRIRFCREKGISFPETKDGIVVFNETAQAAAFRDALSAVGNKSRIIARKIREIEKDLPRDILDFGKKMDEAETSVLAKSKRSGRRWWRLFALLMALCIPGWLFGNGEGLQGLLYKYFTAVCTLFETEQTLAEKCARVLARSDRGSMFGASIVVYGAITAVWTLIIRIFSKKTYASMYANIKKRLYNGSRCTDALKALAAVEKINKQEQLTVAGHIYTTLNDLAQACHQALIGRTRPIELPNVTAEDVRAAQEDAEESLSDNYGAFLEALETFGEAAPYAILWCGADLVSIYNHQETAEQYVFSRYFLGMFNAALSDAREQGRSEAYLSSQKSALESAIFSHDFEATYQEPVSRTDSSTSWFSDEERQNARDNLERWGNLWLDGSFETNEEAVDRAHREGRISDFDAARAKLHGWNPRDLEDDGT